MLIYLASPYSPVTVMSEDQARSVRLNRFMDACKQAAILMDEGHQVFSPIAHSHSIEVYGMNDIRDGDFWLKQDFAMLLHTDEMWVLMLDGWDKSSGVAREIAFCQRNDIPVRFIKFKSTEPLTKKEAIAHGASEEVVA